MFSQSSLEDKSFTHLSEARSIGSKVVNLIVLTATASLGTRKFVLRSLCTYTRKPFILTEVLNKTNFCYRIDTKPDEKKDGLMSYHSRQSGMEAQPRKHLIFAE